ncbi:hypothetical protein DFP74_2326 [Nocardiopsis sp. Huas11]|uniref:hypothetical protein n=1 Tax=Nocardiopsis sp. Huas11 TaxID=2183912 RepID=UPI000EACFAC3|nr:hypothetical protein [Nocardiopsis sp. Huas11]RKS06683.1 hypothetical protein DFP74_2326 [Nocardiopsis sp. Huas11]
MKGVKRHNFLWRDEVTSAASQYPDKQLAAVYAVTVPPEVWRAEGKVFTASMTQRCGFCKKEMKGRESVILPLVYAHMKCAKDLRAEILEED